jgi:hypothetical protein
MPAVYLGHLARLSTAHAMSAIVNSSETPANPCCIKTALLAAGVPVGYQPATGGPRRFCSDRCRQKSYRQRHTARAMA